MPKSGTAFVEADVPMSQATRIPVAVPAVVRSTLAPGESVVWMGQPRQTLGAITVLIALMLGADVKLTWLLTVRLKSGVVGLLAPNGS